MNRRDIHLLWLALAFLAFMFVALMALTAPVWSEEEVTAHPHTHITMDMPQYNLLLTSPHFGSIKIVRMRSKIGCYLAASNAMRQPGLLAQCY